MKIQIDEISYKNFKGFKDFTLTLNGKNGVVSGRNGAGKTSLADGLQWLLFGKNAQGMKLNPKPLDSENNEKLGLNPTIEAQLLIEGKAVTLTRIQEEKWTTKRGELDFTRTSDTTKYFIDGVPTKEKEWKEFLEKLGGEALLQMLSNSSFFMMMDWKKRREVLMSLTGLTDEEIIQTDPELKELSAILDGHTIDEMKKILAAKKKEIKLEIEGIPARIQENSDTLEKILANAGSKEELELGVNLLNHAINELQEKVAIAKNGDSTLDAKQEIANLKLKLSEEERKFSSGLLLATQGLQEDANNLAAKLRALQNEENDLKYKKSSLEQSLVERMNFREKMIEQYKQINSLTFDDHATSCPTCGQDLPSEQVAKLIEKFNIDKSNKLENNKKSVESRKATQDAINADKNALNELNVELLAKEDEIKIVGLRLNEISQSIVEEKSVQGKFEETAEYRKIMDALVLANDKYEKAGQDSSQLVNELQTELNAKRDQLAINQSRLQELKLADDIQKRIDLLGKRDTELKENNQKVERSLWLIDEFTRKKISKIEQSINDKFQLVKWKLFDVQKNGAIAEMCEATFDGVEYNAGLNNGSRINCDLDIINTMSKHFDLYVPVFVDNAESVNELLPIESQMIELQVTEDEKLEVEA